MVGLAGRPIYFAADGKVWVQMRLREGATDASWRRVFNELASDAANGLTWRSRLEVEAQGVGDQTVLVLTLNAASDDEETKVAIARALRLADETEDVMLARLSRSIPAGITVSS